MNARHLPSNTGLRDRQRTFCRKTLGKSLEVIQDFDTRKRVVVPRIITGLPNLWQGSRGTIQWKIRSKGSAFDISDRPYDSSQTFITASRPILASNLRTTPSIAFALGVGAPSCPLLILFG